MITIDLVDIGQLEKDFEGTEIELRATCRKAVERGLDRGVVVARTEHAYKDRTGNLTRSIRPKFVPRRDDAAEGELLADDPKASFVENGTRPHIIRPKVGYGTTGPLPEGQSRRAVTDIGTHRVALRWYVGGRPVFARFVRHPGTKPFPFMGPAYLAMERKMIEVIEVAVSRAQRFFEHG